MLARYESRMTRALDLLPATTATAAAAPTAAASPATADRATAANPSATADASTAAHTTATNASATADTSTADASAAANAATANAATTAYSTSTAESAAAKPRPRADPATPVTTAAIPAAEPHVITGSADGKAGSVHVERHIVADRRIEIFAIANLVDRIDTVDSASEPHAGRHGLGARRQRAE